MTTEKLKISEELLKILADGTKLKRKLLISETIKNLGYSAEELADHSCESLSSRLKSLTGVVINELINSNILTLDEDNLVKKNVIPITEKEIQEYFIKKYLTPEDVKNNSPSGKKNKLKAILGQIIKRKSADNSIAHKGISVLSEIEEEFLENESVKKYILKEPDKYPATPMGKLLKTGDDNLEKLRAKKLKAEEYNNRLKKLAIECINLAGGEFFEQMSMKLLKSCYGAAVKSEELTAGPEDQGIDGILTVEDGLGFIDKIFFQSKTKLNSRAYVSVKVIRELIGVVTAFGATKGVLITNSNFTKETRLLQSKVKNIMLIDSARLFELMKEHCVGIVKEGDYYRLEDSLFLNGYED
jgi:restriction endonuclease Mrr